MPINFDPNSLNSVFDKNFGAGSFNAGLVNAANAARLKQQANFAKTDYLKRLQAAQKAAAQAQKQAQKKTFQDALNYWNDPSRNGDLHQKGAYQSANDLLNDPQAQEELKNQGYSIQNLVDAAYNAASNGQFKSKKAYDQYATELDKNNTNKKANMDSIDMYLQKAKAEEQQQKSQQQSISKANSGQERTGFLGFLDSTLGRIGSAATDLAFGKAFNDAQNQNYQNIANAKLKQNPNDKAALANLQMLNNVTRPAKNGLEKASDFIGGTAGAIAPYTIGGAYGAADALLGKVGLNAIKSPIAKDLVRGLGAGAIGGTERAISQKVASNQQINPTDIAKESLYGGAGDAALGALGRGIMKLLNKGKITQEQAQQALRLAAPQEKLGLPAPAERLGLPGSKGPLGLPEPQLRLNAPTKEPLGLPAPQLRLNAPAPVQPSLDTLLNTGKRANGLQSPIPQMPDTLRNAVQLNKLQKAGAGFGYNAKLEPTARSGYNSATLPKYTKEHIGNKADQLLNDISNVQNKPSNYYEKRLLATQQDMKGKQTNIQGYQKEFQDAVQRQYEYLKNSMGKGVDRGTTSNGLAGNFKQVNGRFAVSNNPGWYQDFYKQFGRKPTNNELKQMAEYQVRNGFTDQFGHIPAYMPKQMEDINNQLDEISTLLDQHPEQQNVLGPIVKALEEDRQQILSEYTNAINGQSPTVDELYNMVRSSNDPASFNDLVRMNQLETNFTKNSPVQGPKFASEVAPNNLLQAPVTQEPKISRLATLDEMVQRLQGMAPPKQIAQEPLPLNFKREIVAKANRGQEAPLKFKQTIPNPALQAQKKDISNSPLFLNLSSMKSDNLLKTVNTSKTLDKMAKDELQTVYKQLQDKKAALSQSKTKASKKQLAAVEADLNKVNKFLMDSNLQMFGKGAEKKSTVNPNVQAKSKQAIKQQQAIAAQKQKKLVEDYQKKKNDLKAEIAGMLKNSDSWKNKGDLALGRETMQRNFEDVMGKDAGKFKEKFLNPISSQEADRVRFLNEERNWAKSHEIKPKSVEDQLVQMYGEKKISLDELKQKTPNWKKVVKVAESYRNKYDELLTKVNKVLGDNGFDPIPKRSDYFPHYEEIDGLMKKFGFDMNNNALPTDINGLTDNFKPNKQFFANALKRKGDQTTFGAIQGFDRYLEGISNVIYHTNNIRQLRALDNVIRTKYQGQDHLSTFASKLTEYANLLAGKKSRIDRSVEDAFGRKVYNAVDTIRRRTGANIIGANVSSALTNFIPLTQSLATTSKPAFVKGLTETLANIGKNDGFIQKSDFLTKRVGSDPLYRNLWDKTVDKSMWLMKTVDSFTSQVVVRGKYNELIAKGVPEEQAIKQADEWANKMMAGRGKGDMPTLFGSKTLGIVSQFQLEVNNQLSFLFKDLPRNSPNKAALASSVGQILLYSYLYNNLYEKAVGRRPAFDPIGIAFQTVKDYNNDNLTKGEATKNLGTNIANQLPFTSIFTGGRFPISSGMPDVGGIATGKANWADEAVKPLLYLGLPTGGGQLKKFVEGMTAMNKNPLSPQGTTGVYQGDKLKFPVADNIPNNLRGPLFGKYSFPEAQAFYDNSRSALSAKQTKQVEMNPDFYQYILEQQRLKRLKKQTQGK